MLNSVISWVGGKRLLRKQIIPLIPKHDTYCEVFGGAGWVLFGKSPEKKDWSRTPLLAVGVTPRSTTTSTAIS